MEGSAAPSTHHELVAAARSRTCPGLLWSSLWEVGSVTMLRKMLRMDPLAYGTMDWYRRDVSDQILRLN